MKGIELPVNTLIIIVIAVIVLVGIIALYLGGWSPSAGGISLTSATADACAKLKTMGYCGQGDKTASIQISDFDADRDGVLNSGTDTAVTCANTTHGDDNLYMLCKCFYLANMTTNATQVKDCHVKVCACPGGYW